MTFDLINLNDNIPVFSSSLYRSSVLENQPAGVEVITVSATDDDLPPHYLSDYGIHEDKPDGQLFSLKTQTVNGSFVAQIFTAEEIDRESLIRNRAVLKVYN